MISKRDKGLLLVCMVPLNCDGSTAGQSITCGPAVPAVVPPPLHTRRHYELG